MNLLCHRWGIWGVLFFSVLGGVAVFFFHLFLRVIINNTPLIITEDSISLSKLFIHNIYSTVLSHFLPDSIISRGYFTNCRVDVNTSSLFFSLFSVHRSFILPCYLRIRTDRNPGISELISLK